MRSALIKIAMLVLWAVLPGPSWADDIVSRESEIKSAALYYVAKFVTWPSESATAPPLSVCVCLAGEDPLNKSIEQMTSGKLIRNRPIRVRFLSRVETVQDVNECNVLFVGENAPSAARLVAEMDAAAPILTIRMGAPSEKTGAIVQFFQENNKLRIVIDQKLAERRGLSISSELLRVAILRDQI